MHRWTPKEIRFLERNIAGRGYAEVTGLFNKHFEVSLTAGQVTSQLKYRRLHNGIRFFYPGHPAYFKSKTKTSWKPGQKPWNYIPIGAERINSDGVVVVKAAETPPKKWKAKHLVIWEKARGPVPEGHFIIFADGNKRNFELSNLLMVSYKEIAVMNRLGLISSHRELTEIGKTIADIKLLIAERERKNQNTRGRPRKQEAKA